jgi:hypothetical protein
MADERRIDQHLQRKAAYLIASTRAQVRVCACCALMIARVVSQCVAAPRVTPVDFASDVVVYGRYSLHELLTVMRDFDAFKADAELDATTNCRVCPSLDQDAIMERDFSRQQQK